MYRLISTLRIDLGKDDRGWLCSFIVNLDRHGCNYLRGGARPRPPKTRIVDLRVGDDILHGGRWRKIHGLEVFREIVITDEEAAKHAGDRGWLTKAPEGYVSPITSDGLVVQSRGERAGGFSHDG